MNPQNQPGQQPPQPMQGQPMQGQPMQAQQPQPQGAQMGGQTNPLIQQILAREQQMRQQAQMGGPQVPGHSLPQQGGGPGAQSMIANVLQAQGGHAGIQNPMASPLAMLTHAKIEHAGMIIKELLKHLNKHTPNIGVESHEPQHEPTSK